VSQVVKLQQTSQSLLKNSLLLSDNLISQVGKLQQVNQSQLNYSKLLSDSLIHQISRIQQTNRNQLEMSNKQLGVLDKIQKEQLIIKPK
jgi:small-conductance mechanosensitive channel